MDRELLVFYKKHGIPMEEADRFADTQIMPPANLHRSLPLSSCVQMIANETKRLKVVRAQEANHSEKLEATEKQIASLAAQCQTFRRGRITAEETHNQEKTDLLTQMMLLFAQVNRLRILSEVLSQRLQQSDKALRVIRSDYDRELEKCKVLMNSQCEEQFAKYKKVVAGQMERVQVQYRAKMQEINKFQSSQIDIEADNDEQLRLLRKQNALLKLRNGQVEKRMKTLTGDLKIAEADRRSEVQNLNQQIASMLSKINTLELKLQSTEQRLNRSMDIIKESPSQVSSSERQLNRSFTKVLAELKRLQLENNNLRSQISELQGTHPSNRINSQRIHELEEELSKKSNDLSYKEQQIDMLSRQIAELKAQHAKEMDEKDQKIRQLLEAEHHQPQHNEPQQDDADYH